MKFIVPVLVLLATTGAFAAPKAPAANTPAQPPVSANIPAAAPASAPAPCSLDDYINELTSTLKLSDADKKTITGIYTADGVQMHNILIDVDITPKQKADQIAGLHDVRNEKIEDLLGDPVRQKLFLWIEAKYRVALTELAADKGLVTAAAPTPPK